MHGTAEVGCWKDVCTRETAQTALDGELYDRNEARTTTTTNRSTGKRRKSTIKIKKGKG